jgi:hypothetical protein
MLRPAGQFALAAGDAPHARRSKAGRPKCESAVLIGTPETARERPLGADARRWSPRHGWWRLVAALAVAWLLPLATHAVHLDVLLLPIIVIGLMAVARGAADPLDRFVLALVQLFGGLCAAGLLFTFWPWHLHPVAIAGFGLTVVVLLAATRRARPVAPGVESAPRGWRRVLRAAWPRPGAVLTVLAMIGVALVVVYPYARRDLAGRIGIPLAGEDITRHFLMFDVIGRTGGYLFLHPHVLRPYVPDDQLTGVANYPQGVHFGYAVVDRFIRSASTNAGTLRSVDIMLWLMVATYVLFALAVLWAVRRVAGPGAGVTRLVPVLMVAAAWLAFADPVAVLSRGYPNEIVGLALNAVLTALVARPLWRLGEQAATVAALIVGVAFSYPLFLPFTVVAAAFWAWRARLWRYRWAWLSLIVVVPVTLVSPLAAMTGSAGNQLLLKGTALPVDRPATVALILLALCGLVLPRGLRSPANRAALFCLGTVCVVAGGVAAYQIATVGSTVYYFDKLVHLLIVVALATLGGLARLVPQPRRAGGLVGTVWRLVPGVALAIPVVLVMAALGGPSHTTRGSPGLMVATGRANGTPDGAADALLMARMYPDGGGAVNVDLRESPWTNWYATQFASALQGTYRYEPTWYSFLDPPGRPETFADLDSLVAASPLPVRFFVYNPAASMLVVDPDHPVREQYHRPGPVPLSFGDSAAPTDIEAVQALAAKYPDKVLVVYAPTPSR